MRFKLYYFFWTIFLFSVELIIALFVNDSFIRPYFGDFLVVILIYTLVRSFFKYSANTVAIGVLVFAFGVEILQYFQVVKVLGLEGSDIAKVVIGTTFDWEDLVAYTLGMAMTLMCERVWNSDGLRLSS